MSGRVVRIFLSSTFRDFGEERDLLVRQLFPTLRARLQSRFVDLIDVDLRWGITAEEAERGDVLPICLSEIDRARPFFIGFLGERYGWVPPKDAYPSHVLETQSWLEEHRGGKSVTELEIMHGVLNNPHMAGRALFYFRSFEYSSSKGGDYVAASADDEIRQKALKTTIRESGFPVHEDYKTPTHLAELLEQNLWEILDREFPASDIPDAFERENLQHEAYALPRQRLYIGGDPYLTALDKALFDGKQWILVDGPSGGGKSALLSNWLKSISDRKKDIEVHTHFLGATADATDPVFLVRRLIECIQRKTESTDDLASDPDELLDSLPIWLANASAWCEMQGKKFLFVIDALNSLSGRRDLRWFPSMLPKHVHLVVSTLPGEVNGNLQDKGEWASVSVMPLDAQTARKVFISSLALFNKTLPNNLVERVMAHTLVVNPLFLLTLAEELRLFGEHEQLTERLDYYLSSLTVDDLFERVLERIEGDFGAKTLKEIMSALWAARAGLREEEILSYSGLKPMQWAYIRNALGPSLIDASGRLIFAHDFMRIAVSDKYMAGNNTIGNEGQSQEALKLRRNAHSKLAKWFESHAFKEYDSIVSNDRASEEIPYQWQQAQEWKKLQSTLTEQDMLVAILEDRSEQELLSYWLILEANIKTDIETQYEKAWKKWKRNENAENTGNIVDMLISFLIFTGRSGSFTENLARLSVTLLTSNLNSKSGKLSNAFNNLGVVLYHSGNYKKAKQYYQKALNITENSFGLEHVETAMSQSNLAVLLNELGDKALAEDLLCQAIATRTKILGIDHHETVTASSNLALILYDNNDFEKALPLFERCLKIRESTLGEFHRETATSLNNLALISTDLGKFNDAKILYERAILIDERTLGPNHPDTATTINNFAIFLYQLKNYESAESYYRRALTIREKSLGECHLLTAGCMNNLAFLMRAKQNFEDAETYFRKSIKIREAILGENDPRTLASISGLASTLYEKSDYENAERLLKSYISRSNDQYLTRANQPIKQLMLLIQILRKNGKKDEASEIEIKLKKIDSE